MIKPMFLLSTEEKESRAWRRLMGHMADRLEQHRLTNESNQPEHETAKLRGRIAELKMLMALDNDLPVADEPPR